VKKTDKGDRKKTVISPNESNRQENKHKNSKNESPKLIRVVDINKLSLIMALLLANKSFYTYTSLERQA
jgi:hypothetical protein